MNEGLTLDPHGDTVAGFRARWADLTQDHKDIFGRLAFDAARARVYIDLKTSCTERRLAIAKAIHTLITHDTFDHWLIRDLVEQITGTWYPTAGEAVGRLDAPQAEEFRRLCELVASEMVDYRWDDATQTLRVNLNTQENTNE